MPLCVRPPGTQASSQVGAREQTSAVLPPFQPPFRPVAVLKGSAPWWSAVICPNECRETVHPNDNFPDSGSGKASLSRDMKKEEELAWQERGAGKETG